MDAFVAIAGGIVLIVAGWAFWVRVITHGDVRPARRPRQVDLDKDYDEPE